MFKYKGIIVSGSHLVFENNMWLRIENSTKSQKIDNSISKLLYCLITKKNVININNIIFSDYTETNNKQINHINNNLMLNYLNNSNYNINFNNITHTYYCGFTSNTIINNIPINKIKIGDKINNSIVIGCVELNGKDIIMYKYKNLVVSGNQCVLENNKWIRVYQSKKSIIINNKYEKIYHLITNDNKILIGDILFRDLANLIQK